MICCYGKLATGSRGPLRRVMRTASQKKRDEAKERSDYGSHLHTWLDSEFERIQNL
jgi:hypothetical protein